MGLFSFQKKERLKSRKLIEQLFKEGRGKTIFPFRVIWLLTPLNTPHPIQFGISVPTRAYPKASDRNHIKRKVREAYRLHKGESYEAINQINQQLEKPLQLAVMLIFISRKPLPYSFISSKLVESLHYLEYQVQKEVNRVKQ